MTGIARLTEEVATPAPAGLADDLWRLAYLRGRPDVDRARPYIDKQHAGIVVFVRREAARTLCVIDTGDRLIGAVDLFPDVPIGSAVRLCAASFEDPVTWRMRVDDVFPLRASVRFDVQPAPDADWIGEYVRALARIRATEAQRIETIAAERRLIPTFVGLPTLETMVRSRADALRREAWLTTDFTDSEREEIGRIRALQSDRDLAARKRGYERERELMRGRRDRYDATLRAWLRGMQDEVGQLRAARQAIVAGNDRKAERLRRLEGAESACRDRIARAVRAERELRLLAAAPVRIDDLTLPESFTDESAAEATLRAIGLLARALPRAGASAA